MLWSRSISREISKVNFSLGRRRKLNLGFFGSLSDSLQGKLVFGNVHSVLALELFNQVFLKAEIEIFSSEGGITVGSLDLKDTARDFEDGNIESSTSKIINGNDFTVCLVKTESESSSSWFVDDSLDLKIGNLTSILGGLSL